MSFENGLKTIVVATDLEGQAEAALEYARKLATNYGARIVLAHGLDPMEYAAVDAVPGNVLEPLDGNARKVLDQLAGELLREGIHSHSEVRQGAVAEMLVDVARQYEAGLIVIGTKGMEGAGPVVVGAIAEQLVRLAPCPVLAVAADWNAGPNRPTAGRTGAAGDGTEQCSYSMRRPRRIRWQRRSSGRCWCCMCAPRPKQPPNWIPARSSWRILASIFARGRSDVRASIPIQCLVKDGDPADAIAEAIAENHPCILVAGVKRASGTPGPHGTAFASVVCLACAGSLRSAGDGERRHGAGSCASGGSLLADAVVFGRSLSRTNGGQKEQPHRFGRSKPKYKPARCGVDRVGPCNGSRLRRAPVNGAGNQRDRATKMQRNGRKAIDDGRPDHSS